MEEPQIPVPDSNSKGVHLAPWEKTFGKIVTPFEEFIHRQTTTGLILMVTTVVALVLANSQLAEIYASTVNLSAGLSVGLWALNMRRHHRVNDGLMASCFFVEGLELKREILVRELAQPRQAALPIAERGLANEEEKLLMAKTGILFSSLIAGIAGTVSLLFCPAAEEVATS